MRYLVLIVILGLMPSDTVKVDTVAMKQQHYEMVQDIDSIQLYIKELITKIDSANETN